MRICVRNLPSDATDEDLRVLFELFGKVSSVQVRGLQGQGFVEMPSKSAARDAIAGLDNQNLLGSDIEVLEMQERRGGPPKGKPRRRRRR